ncbi:cysteine desulfurase family protein [Pseudomonas nunensis]|uniref:cysteine desulfurase n=1 Tax=Pseudomonas nunensis TaxID=2961896 RepID=A0ABY5ERM7_9PSED|nr:aminotransferase class V-fold PLP-dependent enzyme [Pseudomonas nunensis]KPN91156.1 cysteine desulfurase [Pseudomonas nunensis]MCL5227445.1 aminotransferase class V-fold PLP-dependent enzyme [Pseudomonas nunensis]UTO17427.1 aminotransferase class V-fold PLP-dependent enzyme [Pseudomonas nunensis]
MDIAVDAIYADVCGSAPVSKSVSDMLQMLFSTKQCANPNANHALGVHLLERVERARGTIASLLSVDADCLIFNSGSSEGCAQVFHDFFERYKHDQPLVLHSVIEHSCTLQNIKRYCLEGLQALEIGHHADGLLDTEQLKQLLETHEGRPILVCVMAVHNETGVIQPIEPIADLVKTYGGLFFSDMTQAIGKIAVDLHASGVDFAVASGHKFGALPGVGFLYARNRYGLSPLIAGGGQEGGLRGGTQNYPGILSIETALLEKQTKFSFGNALAQQARAAFECRLQALLGDVVVIGQHASRIPCVSFVALPGVNTKKLQWALNNRGIYITTGSACSDKKNSVSHTVTQLGYPERMASSTLRISIDEEHCQFAYERIIEGFAQALSLTCADHPQQSMAQL